MPTGEYRNDHVVNKGDTSTLRVTLYDSENTPYDAEELLSVEFDVLKPDGVHDILAGEIDEEGSGVLYYHDTDLVGNYVVLARFTLADTNEVKSRRLGFKVQDPFDISPLAGKDLIAETVWMKLEDCFDSTEGGPWLRDVTLRYFNKDKIPHFVADALLDINLAPPMTEATLADFVTPNPDGSDDPELGIIVQGTLLSVIRHLMRSYVEQPTPAGAQVVYEDRRDYLQRWQTIYQIEEAHYLKRLALWKRQFLGLGYTSQLIHSKAGRIMQAPMRTRHVGRYGF